MRLQNIFLIGAFAAMAFAANVPIVAVTASGNDGNAPRNAIDGDPGTRWSCANPPTAGCWLQADLGTPRDIGGAGIGWYRGNAQTTSFVIAASADGTGATITWSR